MTEPTSSISITAVLIALLGPFAGPYALIVMAALAGALWPLSTMPSTTRVAGAMFLLRIVVAAVFLTGSAAWYIDAHYQIPATQSMAVLAFFIGAMGNGWRPVLAGIRNALVGFVGRAGGIEK